ncbi:hypothetical protein SISSUDRAFT_1120990 [Sistotremastrum suecicum HHB10207 ss-3]|uniref:MYND-type domain-containing protein n=1 Tax=Sistotremastrum suecicum HHB10207 ss-3 TaxID=1314776 RepID=A0A166BH55_9AGAM|nr:hypothetical protein SISSUDRAFT_1120990 [Sistotremastrum suecicum HHB10207 ss-3]
MGDLAKECDSIPEPFTWDAMGEIVCRHLKLALSTPQEIRRVFKANKCPAVVRKLLQCAEENRGHVRVLGGVLTTFRNTFKDTLFAREYITQNASAFVFRCLELPSAPAQFRELAIVALEELSIGTPQLDAILLQAIAAISKVTPLIPQYTDDPQIFQSLLNTLRRYLSVLNAFKLSEVDALPVQSLQLHRLAKTLVALLDSPTKTVLLPTSIDVISEILMWIAYFESEAIERLPNDKGTLLFVAFLLSPSLPLRCKGFMGLLNLQYSDTAPEVRFCNPQHVLYMDGIRRTPEQFAQTARHYGLDDIRNMSRESLKRRYDNPSVKRLPDGKKFDAYQAGMNVVASALNGPQSLAESFAFPRARLFGGEIGWTESLSEDMEIALRYHGKAYEADVLQLAHHINAMYTALIIENEPDKFINNLYLNEIHMHIRIASTTALQRWPGRSYFYLTMIKFQTGQRFHDWYKKGIECGDCTPYLRSQFDFEMACNEFGLALTHLSQKPTRTWFDEGKGYIAKAVSSMDQAMEPQRSASPQEAILGMLGIFLSLLVPDATDAMDADHFNDLIATLDVFVNVLWNKKYVFMRELTQTARFFVFHHEEAAKRWSPLLSKLKKSEQSSPESQVNSEVSYIDDATKHLGIEENVRGQTSCAWCGRSSTGLRKCGRCDGVKYCDKICQQNHWKAGHKNNCVSPQIKA